MNSENRSPCLGSLLLTEPEAHALMEMCLLSKTEDDPLKAEVLGKIGDLCKQFYQAEAESKDETELTVCDTEPDQLRTTTNPGRPMRTRVAVPLTA